MNTVESLNHTKWECKYHVVVIPKCWHKMLFGKQDGFTMADFRVCAKSALMKHGRADTIVEEVRAAVSKWSDCAEQTQVLSN